jgi:UDP-galactopyranose mutase
MTWDYVIVGAGFAGAVLAERLASQLGKTCLVLDKRDHIAGNAHDFTDRAGVLLHGYGPHYFRTNSPRIVDTSASSPSGIRSSLSHPVVDTRRLLAVPDQSQYV